MSVSDLDGSRGTVQDANHRRPANIKTAFTQVRDFFGVRKAWFGPNSQVAVASCKDASRSKPNSLDTEDMLDKHDLFSLDRPKDSYKQTRDEDACAPTQAKRMRNSEDSYVGVQVNQLAIDKTFVDLLELNMACEAHSCQHPVSAKAKPQPLSDSDIHNHRKLPASDAFEVCGNDTATETTFNSQFDSESESGSENCQSNIQQIIEQLSAEEDETSAPSVNNNNESRNRICLDVRDRSVSMLVPESNTSRCKLSVEQTCIEWGHELEKPAVESSDDMSRTGGVTKMTPQNGGETILKTLEYMLVKENPGYVIEGVDQMQLNSKAMEEMNAAKENVGDSSGEEAVAGCGSVGVVFSLTTRWDPDRVGVGRLWARQTLVPEQQQ